MTLSAEERVLGALVMLLESADDRLIPSHGIIPVPAQTAVPGPAVEACGAPPPHRAWP